MLPTSPAEATPRPLTVRNVHEVGPFLCEHLPCLRTTETIRACQALLAEGAMMGVLIDSRGVQGSFGTVGVGAAAFVSRTFTQHEQACPRPGLTERVMQSALGADRVTLTRRRIEAANAADGLCVAVVLHHWHRQCPDALRQIVRYQLMKSFVADCSGLQLAEMVTEAFGDEELRWCVAGGFQIRSDYADWYSTHSQPLPKRFLIGLTRDEAIAMEGSVPSMLFRYTRPTLGFTASQRRLLSQAVQYQTDAQIAAALGVSLSAVKKAWAGIFQKAESMFDAPADHRPESGPQSTRGAQKRHRLLGYLLEHPEEWRP